MTKEKSFKISLTELASDSPLLDCNGKDQVSYSQHFILMKLTNGPNKLECYNTKCKKGLPRTNTLAYLTHLQIFVR